MKNKKVIALIGTAVLLVGVFGVTYGIRSHQLKEADKKPSMNTEYVEEIDDYKIEKIKITHAGKEYTSVEEIKDIEAGTVVDCHIKLANGDEKDVEGYVTYGDHTDATYNGSLVKITLQKEDESKQEEETKTDEKVTSEKEAE